MVWLHHHGMAKNPKKEKKKPVTGMEGFETFLFNTSVLYNLLVVYAFVQALVLILMLCSFIQRWYIPAA